MKELNTREKIAFQIESLKKEIADLETALRVIDSVEQLKVQREIVEELKVKTGIIDNSVDILMGTLRSLEPLTTASLISAYAKRVKKTDQQVRQFVDSTLSRLVKRGEVERIPSPDKKGKSLYKIKAP